MDLYAWQRRPNNDKHSAEALNSVEIGCFHNTKFSRSSLSFKRCSFESVGCLAPEILYQHKPRKVLQLILRNFDTILSLYSQFRDNFKWKNQKQIRDLNFYIRFHRKARNCIKITTISLGRGQHKIQQKKTLTSFPLLSFAFFL